ncbi:MaoC family dehydratase N-terminal domain-containing protein [Saccharopolyspora halophila]|uniref:MaoC family dehydratase N-terminal domain-containing protein n=1 Tax=Saccharopolyspora halophila TaxID=405551 RepID=A0ABN3GH51_9PSEU
MPELSGCLTGWRPEPLVEHDTLALEQARALAAALGTSAAPADELPPLWHWVHFLDWPQHAELGEDGHPISGRFLPPIPDRRRMFAGGRLSVTAPLRLGTPAERRSELGEVVAKRGRSGDMVFVTVRSEYRQDGELRLTEEQDYVYRSGESAAKDPHATRPTRAPASEAPWQEPFVGDPVRLFRFSALTANSHRIHYDAPYCRDVERYPGLVVHGPLLVLKLAELARRHEHPVRELSYRLNRPVFAGDPVLLCGGPDGRLSVRTAPDQVVVDASFA